MGTNEEDINALKKRIAELEKENDMVIVKNIYMEELLKKHKKSIVWADIPPPASSTVNVPSSGSGSHSNETESSENCNKTEKINDNEKINDEGKIDEEKSKKVEQKTKFLNENLDPIAFSSNGSNDKGNNFNNQQKNIPFTITSVVDKNIKLHPNKGQLRVGSETDQNDVVKKYIDQSIEKCNTIQKNLKETDSSTEHSSSSSKNINKNDVAKKYRGKNGGKSRRNWRPRGGYRRITEHRVTYDGKCYPYIIQVLITVNHLLMQLILLLKKK
ncbi:uncharacterized protein LOC123268741 isoform X1 [Cotesia glomerata]|uniref:Uncharacterized protein n=2 Tax=Cotesia glomerata TaxID=32391 RepID=A0AAV7HRF0_COTGL|nr:uncharacterized protein LOC123268741 isoform X1 [Cotesia glomerata]XP_044590020.1 uncharacterized protein LOC123268741 isoform X1 [Cotesia glomerata]XP_044590022.1 uncharacterized protein LOC123268741 isoform X1 [Cotesia glomerata]XP_044590023.1 uncharacterized protein LOC123268741 isoform X1 [Cotesia glomerata]KAH0546748.1 hypothetical protein KQX54_014643 [Cotesia glomerata]